MTPNAEQEDSVIPVSNKQVQKVNSIKFYITLILAVICTLSLHAAKDSNSNSDNAKRKSHYVFMEAMRQKALGEFASYHELLRHAYSIDTTNTAIAYHLGYNSLILIADNATQESVNAALEMMKKHFDSTPKDYNESFLYGNACSRLRKNDEALRVWKKLTHIFPTKVEVKYMLADAYAANKDYNAAITLYDSIETNEGVSIPLTVKKVNYRLATNDSIGAINEVKSLLASAPSNVEYNLLTGNIYLQFAERDSAIFYFNKAHEIEPDNGYVYLYKADYYKLQGDSINYDKQIYNALINKNLEVEQKTEILTDYVRGEFSAGIQQSERIDKLFDTLIEQHPHEIAIHDLYSQYLVAIKDYTSAAEQLGYVLDLEPTNADNWKKIMFINLMDKNYDEAFKAADKALEYNPENIDLYQYIAPAYFQIKQYDKAIEIYKIALEKADTANYELMSNLVSGIGDVYYTQGDTLQAFAQYEKALEYNPGNIMAMNNYAYFLAESGKDLDKAERLSSTTVKYEPENPTYLDTYAWIYFKKGEYSLALTYMKSAIIHSEKEEPSAELYEHYGDILFMNGYHEEALPNWEKALELKPESEILQRKVKHKTFFFK